MLCNCECSDSHLSPMVATSGNSKGMSVSGRMKDDAWYLAFMSTNDAEQVLHPTLK